VTTSAKSVETRLAYQRFLTRLVEMTGSKTPNNPLQTVAPRPFDGGFPQQTSSRINLVEVTHPTSSVVSSRTNLVVINSEAFSLTNLVDRELVAKRVVLVVKGRTSTIPETPLLKERTYSTIQEEASTTWTHCRYALSNRFNSFYPLLAMVF